jgi:cell cycle arrest protein BUB2
MKWNQVKIVSNTFLKKKAIVTFSACTPPLSELLHLWDYMFAYGIHLNILFVIAQLALIRTELLHSPR